MTSYCWKVRPPEKPKECEHSNCCYNASCQAVFDYWKYAHDEWKRIVEKELEREKQRQATFESR